MLVPVILCGGAGTRLWPMSRQLYPKQLLPLTSEKSLLQETLVRLDGLPDLGDPVLICNQEHRFLVAEQVRQINRSNYSIILEPEGRGTAPATAIAAQMFLEKKEDPVLLVLPADHVIKDKKAFQEAIQTGRRLAEKENLITFGIRPNRAETGYGYIRKGWSVDYNNEAYFVDSFQEKPDKVTAESYYQSGDYFWNSGMFLFQANTYMRELESFQPEMVKHCSIAYQKGTEEKDFFYLQKENFLNSPNDTIDYAVMEKTQKAVVVPFSADWSDVGSWEVLWEIGDKNEQGNLFFGDVLSHEVQNSYIRSQKSLIAAVGLMDTVIVETRDAILVADKKKTQDVKKIVNKLKEMDRDEYKVQKRVYRPWGFFQNLELGDRFQVKRIMVKVGSVLSLQKHHHRAEHWIIVKGTGQVTLGQDTFLLTEGQSTYIPLGEVHRIGNPGNIDLEFIEVQIGTYLGEDDIVRLEDQYGRIK